MASVQRDRSKIPAAARDSSEVLSELKCPICKETLREPYSTTCGHTFCHDCIQMHLTNRQKCPCCNTFLTSSHIHPIFALEKVISAAAGLGDDRTESLKAMLASTPRLKTCTQIDELISVLSARRTDMQKNQQETKIHLLLHFLQKARSEMLLKLEDVKQNMACIKTDLTHIRHTRASISVPGLPTREPGQGDVINPGHNQGEPGGVQVGADAISLAADPPVARLGSAPSTSASVIENGNKKRRLEGQPSASEGVNLDALTGALVAKKKLYVAQFDEFQSCYLNMCREEQNPEDGNHPALSTGLASGAADEGCRLPDFSRKLTMATQYVAMNMVGDIVMTTGTAKSQAASSLEFNCDQQAFAAGGSSPKIKIYNYDSVIAGGPRANLPMAEVTTRSRVGCLSWSPVATEQLLHCGSLDGSISLWNTMQQQEIRTFEGHSQRVWSIDYSMKSPQMFVSGSDDASARVWTSNQRTSVMNLPMSYNVCCCAFSSSDSHTIAVGTAGHTVGVYDLRNTKHPLALFEGHKKAVSYVKFVSGKQVVSASVDSSLTLWDVPSASPVRKFTGHTNKKNFVGLSVNGGYIACGSETSQVYVYFMELSKPILEYTLASAVNPSSPADAQPCFTSAVTWKPNSTHLLAASSSGRVQALALTECPSL